MPLINAWPCLDKAPYREWMTTATDLDGRPRILGKAADFGAYETSFTDISTLLRILTLRLTNRLMPLS